MPLERAIIQNLDSGQQYEVLFNPSEYTVNKDNNFAQANVFGLSAPLLQFVHGNLQTLDMELFFDSLEAHQRVGANRNSASSDVRKLTQPVVDLMAINPETHAPPVVLFTWGSLTFTGVLARVNQHFTMFLENGKPVRARLQVTFQEWKSQLQEAKEVKRQTADYTRVYQVGTGQTLAAIAAEIYHDPEKWRPIAIANQLEDVRRLQAGAELKVPSLPYRDPDSGELFT